MKKFLPLLLCLFLVGCESEIEIPVNYSEVFSDTPKISTGIITLDNLPSCNEKVVSEAIQKIDYIFPSAKYLGCKEEVTQTSWRNFIIFEIPVQIGGIGVRDCSNSQVCVASSQNNQLMNIFIGEDIRKKIDLVLKSSSSTRKDFRITVALTNDTNDSLPVYILSSFVHYDERLIPYYNTKGELPKGTVSFVLGNVATETVLSKGFVSLLKFPEREPKSLLSSSEIKFKIGNNL